ncbi:MarR family winged helix-turn-helix transcriptional regulator [Actinoplanes sp. CA-054009]
MKSVEVMRVNSALNKMGRLYRVAKGRRLGELGLHPGQDVLLWQLGQEPDGITVTELAARLGVEPPTATRSLARLGGGGWFRREPVPGDRRQVRIVITEAGLKLIPRIEDAWNDLADQIIGSATVAERAIVLSALERANDRLRADLGDDAPADD